MELNMGIKAATRQSWQHNITIRVYIKEIQERHPSANEKKLVALLAERMREDDDVLIAGAEYAIRNAMNVQYGYTRRSHTTPEERANRAKEIELTAENIVGQILLLNMEMPNGKRMRFCTGEEMEKFGNGYKAIARKVGKTKLVGSVLNEAEIRKLMR